MEIGLLKLALAHLIAAKAGSWALSKAGRRQNRTPLRVSSSQSNKQQKAQGTKSLDCSRQRQLNRLVEKPTIRRKMAGHKGCHKTCDVASLPFASTSASGQTFQKQHRPSNGVAPTAWMLARHSSAATHTRSAWANQRWRNEESAHRQHIPQLLDSDNNVMDIGQGNGQQSTTSEEVAGTSVPARLIRWWVPPDLQGTQNGELRVGWHLDEQLLPLQDHQQCGEKPTDSPTSLTTASSASTSRLSRHGLGKGTGTGTGGRDTTTTTSSSSSSTSNDNPLGIDTAKTAVVPNSSGCRLGFRLGVEKVGGSSVLSPQLKPCWRRRGTTPSLVTSPALGGTTTASDGGAGSSAGGISRVSGGGISSSMGSSTAASAAAAALTSAGGALGGLAERAVVAPVRGLRELNRAVTAGVSDFLASDSGRRLSEQMAAEMSTGALMAPVYLTEELVKARLKSLLISHARYLSAFLAIRVSLATAALHCTKELLRRSVRSRSCPRWLRGFVLFLCDVMLPTGFFGPLLGVTAGALQLAGVSLMAKPLAFINRRRGGGGGGRQSGNSGYGDGVTDGAVMQPPLAVTLPAVAAAASDAVAATVSATVAATITPVAAAASALTGGSGGF